MSQDIFNYFHKKTFLIQIHILENQIITNKSFSIKTKEIIGKKTPIKNPIFHEKSKATKYPQAQSY